MCSCDWPFVCIRVASDAVRLLCMSPKDTFGPRLCARRFTTNALGTFIQIVDDIVVVVGSVIVHVSVLQEFWSAKNETEKRRCNESSPRPCGVAKEMETLTGPNVCTVEVVYDSCRLLVAELRPRVMEPLRLQLLLVPSMHATNEKL